MNPNFDVCPNCKSPFLKYVSHCTACGYENKVGNRFTPENKNFNFCEHCASLKNTKNGEWPCCWCEHNPTHR